MPEQFTAERRERLERYITWNLRIGNDSDQVLDTAALLAHCDRLAEALAKIDVAARSSQPTHGDALRCMSSMGATARTALASHPRKEP